MPEVRFEVRFSDGREASCYSPSLVVRELLEPSVDYPLYEFMARARAALTIGAERVRAKYGFHCSAAMDQLGELERLSAHYDADALVRVLAYR